MATKQLGTPAGQGSYAVVDPALANGLPPGENGAVAISAAQFARFKDNAALDTACTGISGTLYTAAYLNTMTANDKLFVCMLNAI